MRDEKRMRRRDFNFPSAQSVIFLKGKQKKTQKKVFDFEITSQIIVWMTEKELTEWKATFFYIIPCEIPRAIL